MKQQQMAELEVLNTYWSFLNQINVGYNEQQQIYYLNNTDEQLCCFFDNKGVVIQNSTLRGYIRNLYDSEVAGLLVYVDSENVEYLITYNQKLKNINKEKYERNRQIATAHPIK